MMQGFMMPRTKPNYRESLRIIRMMSMDLFRATFSTRFLSQCTSLKGVSNCLAGKILNVMFFPILFQSFWVISNPSFSCFNTGFSMRPIVSSCYISFAGQLIPISPCSSGVESGSVFSMVSSPVIEHTLGTPSSSEFNAFLASILRITLHCDIIENFPTIYNG